MSSDAVVEPVEPAVTSVKPAEQLSLMHQMIRFVGIGVFAAGVDFGSYTLILHFGVWADLARACSFTLGTTTAYLLNRRFTFRAKGGGATVARFVALYGTTFFVTVGVNALFLWLLHGWSLAVTASWVISQGTATVINFVMLRLVVFREPRPNQANLANQTTVATEGD